MLKVDEFLIKFFESNYQLSTSSINYVRIYFHLFSIKTQRTNIEVEYLRYS